MIDGFPPQPPGNKATLFSDVLIALLQDSFRAIVIAFALTGKLEFNTFLRCLCGYFVFVIIKRAFTNFQVRLNVHILDTIEKEQEN